MSSISGGTPTLTSLGVTAAAQTVLDDTTVGDMLATMSGVAGAASGYKIARGTTNLTGTATVTSGLATCVAVIATCKTDISIALCGCSASVGDQAGLPAAGSFYLKTWKHTAAGNCTEIAASVAADVQWVAIGT